MSDDLRAQRLAKLEAIKASGINPYPEKPFTKEDISVVLAKPEGSPVQVAGRIMLFREMGNITFFHIQDWTGRMQIVLNKRSYTGDYKFWLKKLDIGDIVHISGERIITQKGEPSVMVKDLTLISKSLLPLPEKWHGLSDSDQIYRQRYLDMIMNRDSFDRFVKRSRMVSETRSYLNSLGFIEVETPMLQEREGGAAAKPFITHFNALNHDYSLRIATELHLKRTLVGGIEKVYEIGKNFRNEGIDRKHNPEYTGFEIYQAYSDMRGMMDLLKGIVGNLCEKVFHKWQFTRPDTGVVIDFSKPWREVRYRDIICEYTKNPDWFKQTKEEKLVAAKALGVDVTPKMEDFEVTNEIYSKKIEPSLQQPTFVTHWPRELCPLAKSNVEDPSLIDIFECAISGMEISPAYTELNNPIQQREILLKQAGDEAWRFDEDFITALEYGMPSAGGIGIGLERLVMIMTEAASIRDVILYPTLKPQSQA